jgi:hypothetical protein
MPTTSDTVGVAEAAKLLGVDTSTVYAATAKYRNRIDAIIRADDKPTAVDYLPRDGEVPSYRIGHTIRIPRLDVERLALIRPKGAGDKALATLDDVRQLIGETRLEADQIANSANAILARLRSAELKLQEWV